MIQRTSRTGGGFSSPSSADELSIDHLDLLDERHITIVKEAIAEGRIGYAVRSIHAIGHPDQILYRECLPCLIEQDGTEHINGGFVHALEILQEAPVLDRYMLKLALDELDSDPSATLGCHLSADNFSSTETWAQISNQIVARSELASRLIINIDAASPFADTALASDLLSEVRAFGCRVAMDGFDDGPSLGLDADIVKIDAPFAIAMSCEPDHLKTLSLAVAPAARAALVVVVEGIETAEQLETARLVGATHVRDHHVGRPVFPLLAPDGRL